MAFYFSTCFPAGSVILESPALSVIEGDTVSLHCRSKTIIPNLQVYFYKDGLLMENSSAGEMVINSVSKSDVGLYKCSIPGVGYSPGNWFAVRGITIQCLRLKSSVPKQNSFHWCLYVSMCLCMFIF